MEFALHLTFFLKKRQNLNIDLINYGQITTRKKYQKIVSELDGLQKKKHLIDDWQMLLSIPYVCC